MKLAKTSTSYCTGCGQLLDGAGTVGGDAESMPSPGDVTVCIYCGHIMAFDEQLGMRNLTADEMIEVAGDPRILSIQRARKRLEEE